MHKRRIATRSLGMLFLCSLVLNCAQMAMAWSYHSFAYGYSISLPEDWVHVPEEVLSAQLHRLPDIGGVRGRVDVAFQAKRDNTIDFPFIIVEVFPYSQFGYPRQVDDREIRQIVRNSTGLDPSNPFVPETRVVEGGGEAEVIAGGLHFDAEGRNFVWSSTSSMEGVGLIRARQWGFFGKDALVQVTLFEKGKGSDRLRDMAEAIAGSFKFEIGKEYQPAFTIGDAMKMLRQMVASPNLGIVVTLLCVVTAVLFAVIALLTNRPHREPEEQYSIFDRTRL